MNEPGGHVDPPHIITKYIDLNTLSNGDILAFLGISHARERHRSTARAHDGKNTMFLLYVHRAPRSREFRLAAKQEVLWLLEPRHTNRPIGRSTNGASSHTHDFTLIKVDLETIVLASNPSKDSSYRFLKLSTVVTGKLDGAATCPLARQLDGAFGHSM